MYTQFPPGFVWGTATSAYQIEGATTVGGRGRSIWDSFCAVPGAVRNGDTGDIACDFYHRYPADIAIMRELGIDTFRFSIAWPRVIPDGRGRVESRGLDFYDRLVDALLSAGIRPLVNLYHWDLPQSLEDAGGWVRRETADAFAEYAAVVAHRLADRVHDWTTHNEPYCTAWLGYADGVHAPGRRDRGAAIAAAHHVLLSHGWAAQQIRSESARSRVGIILDSWPAHPATDAPADAEAAARADAIRNRLWFEPVLLGAYPQAALDALAPHRPPVRTGDLAAIATPLDFLGVNCYSRTIVRATPDGQSVEVRAPSGRLTDMGWEVYPDGLLEVLRRAHFEYHAPPLYVTENGAAFADVPGHDGRIRDTERIEYLNAHIGVVARALAEGIPVHGYFVWSLLDNFEWSLGYSKRFGLVYVDYPTLTRIPKDSFYWYRNLIAEQRREVAAA
jgi:beta-glucosidase